jgi:SAM-dependent methyltransferase
VVVGGVRGRRRIPGTVPLSDNANDPSFRDHFSTIAKRYAAYRPHYPQSVAEALAARTPRRELAWDAGCGNGQFTVQLGAHFAHVIGTEPSQQQLDEAAQHPRVEYRCAKAEDPVLAPASVDLAVAAQAAHWFDWPRYVAEVARVTRPGALVGILTYVTMHLEGEADALLSRYYHADVGRYWPPGRELVENGYRDLSWPWPAVEAPRLDMTAEWTRDEMLGYVATWSATVRLVQTEGPAKYDALGAALARIWADGERRTVRWPLAIKLARRQ